MNILNLSLGQDTGGQQMRLMRGWRKLFPQDRYISITTKPTFYEIEYRYSERFMREEWEKADVVHLNNDLRFIERFKGLPKRPLLIHHHGTMYRTRPEYHLQALREYRAIGLCSTVDLWAIAPDETVWLPQAYDPEELQAYRNPHPQNGILRIAHAPTNRPIKSTDALQQAFLKLKRLGIKVELDIIENVKNRVCLERKGRADVFVDQLILGYGCNAIEAWGMGIPVIAGVDVEGAKAKIRQSIPSDTMDRMIEKWGVWPFYSSTERGLIHSLLEFKEDRTRTFWTEEGVGHFNRHHSMYRVLPYLRGLYQRAMG